MITCKKDVCPKMVKENTSAATRTVIVPARVKVRCLTHDKSKVKSTGEEKSETQSIPSRTGSK